jgi:hypothetical protein
MIKYKLTNHRGVPACVQKYVDDMFQIGIPFDLDNTDYQAYLRWLEAGNTPEPAEENQ